MLLSIISYFMSGVERNIRKYRDVRRIFIFEIICVKDLIEIINLTAVWANLLNMRIRRTSLFYSLAKKGL